MAPASISGVTLQVGQQRTLNIVVQPSSVARELTVFGGGLTVLDTNSASMGGNVSAGEVAELPINGRQISQLYFMTPGALNFASGTFADIPSTSLPYRATSITYA